PVVRLGRCVRVPAPALRRWLESQYDSETSPPARSQDGLGHLHEDPEPGQRVASSLARRAAERELDAMSLPAWAEAHARLAQPIAPLAQPIAPVVQSGRFDG